MITADADTNAGRNMLPPPPKRQLTSDLRKHFESPVQPVQPVQPVASPLVTLESEMKARQDNFSFHMKCKQQMVLVKKKGVKSTGSPQAVMFDLQTMFAPDAMAIKWEKASRDTDGVSHFYGFVPYDVFGTFMQDSVRGARGGEGFSGNDKTVAVGQRSFCEVISTTKRCKLYFDVEARMDHKITPDDARVCQEHLCRNRTDCSAKQLA